jgi:hypothetical protein
MSEEHKAVITTLGRVQTELTQINTGINDAAAAVRKRQQVLNDNIQALTKLVVEIDTRPKPKDDPKRAAEIGKATGESFRSLADAVTGLQKSVILGQQGRTQEAAAEGFRVTGKILSTAGPLVKVVPPPIGLIVGGILDALQGMCDFTATILDLTKPPGPKEKSLEQALQDKLETAFAIAEINKIFGTKINLTTMGVMLESAVKHKTGQHKDRVDTLPQAYDYTEIIGHGGEAESLNSCQSWI